MGYYGELAGFFTAISWTITALAFQIATRRAGSLTVNFMRLFIGSLLFLSLSLIKTGTFIPTYASSHEWFWLSISAVVGYLIGDFFLFKSYLYVSARISMLMMALAPPIAAVVAWLWMDEQFTMWNGVGMFITLAGIIMVVFKKGEKKDKDKKLSKKAIGILFAFGGAVGQGVGAVISKVGMRDGIDPFDAGYIRAIVGMLCFAVVMIVMGKSKKVLSSITNWSVMKPLTTGAFFGPFLGVSLSMLALQHLNSGVASTFFATVPVFILFPAYFMFKEKITLREVIGAVVTVVGLAIFFIE